MDKTRTIGQKWLANELIHSFLALKKCAKAQSNPVILSKVIVFTNDRRQTTDTGVKTLFSTQGVSKHGDFMKIGKMEFSHKTNTFSYDENVKSRKIISWYIFCKVA